MITKTSWQIGPEMRRISRENEGKHYLSGPNNALAIAALIPQMMVLLGSSAHETVEQWFSSGPVIPFLDQKLIQCVSFRKCLTHTAKRMASVVDFVGNMIGVTMYLYDSGNTELCVVQVLVEPTIGAPKEIKQLPPSGK